MRVVEMIATAGGSLPNEDRAGHAGTLAWVIDGATDLYDDVMLPASNDVQWLVDRLVEHFTSAGEQRYCNGGPQLLEYVAGRVSEQMSLENFPQHRVPPACSLAILVDHGETYEITRLGDATAMVTGHEPVLINTEFFDRREAAAVSAQHTGMSPQEVRDAMRQRRLATMTGGALESILSGHPDRVLRAHTHVGKWSEARSILLCTDGFARLFTDYGQYPGWADMLAESMTKGLAHQENLLRHHEACANGMMARRFKHADDAAAVLVIPKCEARK